jgi:hypothetical protein
MKDGFYAVAASVGGVAFYFAIIGVLEHTIACVSLLIFVCVALAAWLRAPDTEIGPASRSSKREGE